MNSIYVCDIFKIYLLWKSRVKCYHRSCLPLSSPLSLDVFSHVSADLFMSVPSPTTSCSSLSLDTSHVVPEVPLLPTFQTLAPPSFSCTRGQSTSICLTML